MAFFVLINSKNNQACFNKKCFSVEIANNDESRTRGLMYRQSLPKDSGMLFVFDKEGEYPFWMKNTLIPLDIIWIDKDKKVIYINENTQPCKTENCASYGTSKNAKYVLELNAGQVKEIGLKAGDFLH